MESPVNLPDGIVQSERAKILDYPEGTSRESFTGTVFDHQVGVSMVVPHAIKGSGLKSVTGRICPSQANLSAPGSLFRRLLRLPRISGHLTG
jgi:hypothetical protein